MQARPSSGGEASDDRHKHAGQCAKPQYDMQARPSSGGEASSRAAAQEAALAAVEEEWGGRLAEALALCQDQEAALEKLQQRSLRDRRFVPAATSASFCHRTLQCRPTLT